MVDSFMGQTVVEAPLPENPGKNLVREERGLTGRGSKSGDTKPGKIFIEYETSEDLMTI